MRHVVLILVALLVAALAWRVRSFAKDGDGEHQREVAARQLAEQLLRAEEARRLTPPGDSAIAPYGFLANLVAERRVTGLVRVAATDRDLWSAGGYVFHVRLLNQLGRPLAAPPADPASEPGLGLKFELWAWPADAASTTLALFFGSQAGYLLQGDNGAHAGLDARPEDAFSESPLREVEQSRDGAGDQWITLVNIRR